MTESTADILALTDFSRKRSLWLRAFNALGAPFKHRVGLEEGELLETARARTGLTDFGGDEFREPLRRFLDSLVREAHLTCMGRLLARRDVLVILINRLQITDTLRRHPEIAEQEIREPLFIVGLSRSGTSILHELLTCDPRFRTLLSWEARYPCPPPEEARYESDPRIARADREFKLWPKLVPAYQSMHENGGRIPAECGDITCYSLLGDHLPALHQVPSFAAWAAEQDIRPAYEWHKKALQILQWKVPRERWLLKAPAHLNWLPTLLDVYPDARLVQTHRDPLQIMGSTVSLISAILWMRADAIDPDLVRLAFGPAYYAPQLENVMAVRDRGVPPASQIVDVRFADLMKDHFGTIEKIYQAFGWAYTKEAEERMRDYLAHKPRGKFGKHFYSFHDLGLDLETERARYRAYQERFDVPSEVF